MSRGTYTERIGGVQQIDMVRSAIEEQVDHIQRQQNRSAERQLVNALEDEGKILRCYRRIEALFRQLQVSSRQLSLDVKSDYVPDGHFS
jgi:hypothetical protein